MVLGDCSNKAKAKAKAGAGAVSAVVEAVKAAQNFVALPVRDAGAVIGHGQAQAIFGPRHLDVDVCAGRGKAQGVVDEVDQSLRDQFRVHVRRHRLRRQGQIQVVPQFFGDRLQHLELVASDIAKINAAGFHRHVADLDLGQLQDRVEFCRYSVEAFQQGRIFNNNTSVPGATSERTIWVELSVATIRNASPLCSCISI